MPSSNDRFINNPRAAYILSNHDLTATCKLKPSGLWEAVIKYANGQTEGITFRDESAMREHCFSKTKTKLNQSAATPTTHVDRVAEARAKMREAAEPVYTTARGTIQPSYLPANRSAVPVATNGPSFQYTAQQIEEINASILKVFIVNHPGLIYDHTHNFIVLAQCLTDLGKNYPGMVLSDETITNVVEWLTDNGMLYDGKKPANPYRKPEDVAQAASEYISSDTQREVNRRRQMPLPELQKLVESETGTKLGDTISPTLVGNGKPKSHTPTVPPVREEIVPEDLQAARKLSFDELAQMEKDRQARRPREPKVWR